MAFENSSRLAPLPASGGLVTLATNGAVAELAISNGPLNLVTNALLRAVSGLLAELASRRDVRCVIFHGGSVRAFCAGSDMKEFAQLRDDASLTTATVARQETFDSEDLHEGVAAFFGRRQPEFNGRRAGKSPSREG